MKACYPYVKAWVGNLGKYNEGDLVGEWVEFPIDDDDREDVLQRIGIGDPVDQDDPSFGIYEEYFFPDYDSELPLFEEFSEYASYEELNEIAEAVEDVEDFDILIAIIGNETSLSAAIQTYKSGDWRDYPGCEDMSDVAMRCCEDDPAFTEAEDFMRRHFDFESYGQELESCGTFLPYDGGYVELW
ncbi:MAG: antirestriction protein ArdA [Eggerthellaceae bacterium]|nr:antirestriction protein ArdA [Eggerthellaceae bacterium]